MTIKGTLRLLETTDLHMHLRSFDYFADREDPTIGLSGLIDAISALRTDPAVTSLLFDNGDFLQGNPLADYLARDLKEDETHPMIAAMNLLKYDAVTLGNHEFDYGPTFLRRALDNLDCPVVSANVDPAARLATPFTILDKTIACKDGKCRAIKIGITGFAPPQASDWVPDGQTSNIAVADIIQSARKVVPQMKEAGADIVVALCHSGIGPAQISDQMENAARHVAAIDGIDVLCMGHTHEVFPDAQRPKSNGVDPARGTLHGKPAVMAGFYGRQLGVIDLELQRVDGQWHICGYECQVIKARQPNVPPSPAVAALTSLTAKAHDSTRALMCKSLCQTDVHLHSYFATIQPDNVGQLLADVMTAAVTRQLAPLKGAPPILAAVAPFRFGGRSGLGHYIDVPKGPLTLRDATAIFPFSDPLCAVRRTGAQIRNWLERAASYYSQISAGQHDQPLINPEGAGYNCDALYGLRYAIDLTKPARFDTNGQLVAPLERRIIDLEWCGQPVNDADIFTVATNSFRAKGGGGFETVSQDDVIWIAPTPLRDVLRDALGRNGWDAGKSQPVWRFTSVPDTTAIFQSAPVARTLMPPNITHLGTGHDGFDRYRIKL